MMEDPYKIHLHIMAFKSTMGIIVEYRLILKDRGVHFWEKIIVFLQLRDNPA